MIYQTKLDCPVPDVDNVADVFDALSVVLFVLSVPTLGFISTLNVNLFELHEPMLLTHLTSSECVPLMLPKDSPLTTIEPLVVVLYNFPFMYHSYPVVLAADTVQVALFKTVMFVVVAAKLAVIVGTARVDPASEQDVDG